VEGFSFISPEYPLH